MKVPDLSQLKKKEGKEGVVPNTVMIGTLLPMYCTSDYTECLATLMMERAGSSGPIRGYTSVTTARSYTGRNDIIRRFLDGPCEYLLWIDSDMQFSVETFDRLWAAAHEAAPHPTKEGEWVVPTITTALAFIYSTMNADMRPNIFLWDEEKGEYGLPVQYHKDKRFWVDATGVAFTLIHRQVFEDVGFPWHENHIDHPEIGGPLGHDVSFFREAQKKGHHVLYCADAKTGHVKPMSVSEAMYENYLATGDLELL